MSKYGVFSPSVSIQSEYRKILCKFSYSGKVLENRDHKKTQYSDIFYATSVMLKVKNPLDQKFLIQRRLKYF